MPDPRITERVNPLVAKLNAVAQMNVDMGTPLGGGAAPPPRERPAGGPVVGGSARVLPPPPVPLGEDLPAAPGDLEAEWANDPSNPVNRRRDQAEAPPAWTPPRRPPAGQSAREFIGQTPVGAIGIPNVIDILKGLIFTTTGRTFVIPEEEVKQLRIFASRATVRAIADETNREIAEMREALGIAAPTDGGRKDEAVSGVREGEGGGAVPAEAKPVPPVREPGARKARARRKVSGNVEGKGGAPAPTGSESA